MEEAAARAALKRLLEFTDHDITHEVYHEDAVLEFPQSGERFEGVENFREWRKIYPANVEGEIRRIRGRDDLWVVEGVASYDGGPPHYGVSIHEFRGNKVVHETIYVGEGWEAPEWRAPWRTAPPHEAGGEPAREPTADADGA